MQSKLLRIWGFLEEHTGIPLRFWLRGTSSLADLGTLALLYLAARSGTWPIGAPLLCVIAGSPVAIFVSGFHGNTDPIMLFFIVASAFMMEVRRNIVACGLLLGVALIQVGPLHGRKPGK